MTLNIQLVRNHLHCSKQHMLSPWMKTSVRYSSSLLCPKVWVFSKMLRTSPLLSGSVSITRPMGHTFLGEWSSLRSTTSPTAIFRTGWFHFCRSCKVKRYSLFQRDQNKLARYWTLCQRRRM